MSIEPFTEDERHRAYQDAQRMAFVVAQRADQAVVGLNATADAVDREFHRAQVWATVALALRRDGVQ